MNATPLPFAVGSDDEQSLVRALCRQRAIGVALLAPDGRYALANAAFCELLGRSEETLRGLSWRDVTHPDDVAVGERILAAVERGATPELEAEKRYVRPDGEVRWALAGVSVLGDDEGAPAGYLTQVVDVTDRKRAEAAFRAERGLLELLTAVTVAVNESATAEHAFRVAVNAVCAHTGWPLGHVVDADGARLVASDVWVAADPGVAAPLRAALGERSLDDAGAAAAAARTRRPVWSADLSDEPAAEHWRTAGATAVGAWPVIAADRLLAVLEFGARDGARPPEGLSNALTSACSQLAQALVRTQTLERLRSSEQQLSEAQAVAGLGSWRWDLETGEVAWSEQFFRTLGRRPHSVAPSVGWLLAHVHEDDRDHVQEHLEHTLETGVRLDVEFRLVGADGRLRTVVGGGEITPYERGGRRHLVGYLQDISARAEAKAALARSEERVRLILETSSDGFVEYDRDCVVVEWNRAAEALFGWTRDEAVGRRIDELLPPEGAAGEHLIDLLTNLESPALDTAVETTARHRDGELVPVEVTIARTPDQVLRSTFIRDISERKRAEHVLHETNASLRRSVAALEQRSREVTVLNEMIDLLQSASEAAEGYQVIARHAAQLFPDASGGVYVAQRTHGPLVAVADWGGYESLEPTIDRDDCWALRRSRVHRTDPAAAPLHCPHASNEQRSTVCVPMLVQGEVVGLVHLRVHATDDPFAAGEDLLLTDFAERTGLALANMRLRERLHTQSIRDPLTGLFNRRYLEETFERELSRAQRNGHPLGVAMIDLDDFKRFNDRFGHQVGDAALQAFAGYLQAHVRASDVACRYGGEEFVVLFPDATLEQVRERCEALRIGAGGLVLPADRTPWQATVSVGTAAYPYHGEDAATILRAADTALYTAKRTGRDRVVVADLSV